MPVCVSSPQHLANVMVLPSAQAAALVVVNVISASPLLPILRVIVPFPATAGERIGHIFYRHGIVAAIFRNSPVRRHQT